MDNTYRKLINFIDNLIRDKAKLEEDGYELDIRDLSIEEKEYCCALFIENDDRDLFCIYENRNYDDITSNLINLLKESTYDNKYDFIRSIQHNISNYYSDKIKELIDERLPIVQIEDREFLQLQYTEDGHWI